MRQGANSMTKNPKRKSRKPTMKQIAKAHAEALRRFFDSEANRLTEEMFNDGSGYGGKK